MTKQVKSEDTPDYRIKGVTNKDNDYIIQLALDILEKRLGTPGALMETPDMVRNYLKLQLAEKESEVFCALFLDNRHCIISFDEMFQGTIDGASVHPREVVKRALKYNAAAIILAHNHPSGNPEPSRADEALTKRLTDALALIDIKVLDHIIIGGVESISFAERGLI